MSETINQTSDNPGSLRMEARFFKLNDLNKSQIEALWELLLLLEAAVNSAGNIDWNDASTDPFEKINFSRIAFLSGGRGTGKTSLLLSLKRYLRSGNPTKITDCTKHDNNKIKEDCRNICDVCINSYDPKKKCNKENDNCFDLCDICEKIIKKIENKKMGEFIWLETLDMEPLPGPVNLLASILARIEHAVEQFQQKGPYRARTPNRPSPLEQFPDYRKIIMEMQHMQQDVTVAWEGNIYQQAPNIDPDTFAAEVFRAERSRISLNERFIKLLRDLSHNIFNTAQGQDPLFILPIDDFDLNPLRCLELLRLISMVSSPHLFTIILGDITITRKVLNLKFANELTMVKDQERCSSFISKHPRHIDRLANDISSNAVRKLLPPSHIVLLADMIIENVFRFAPDKQNESIGDLLREVPVQINTAQIKTNGEESGIIDTTKDQYLANKPVTNLYEFFNATTVLAIKEKSGFPRIRHCSQEELGKVYCARKLFEVSIRLVQDMWRYLKRYQKNMETGEPDIWEQLRKCISIAWGMFIPSVLEDKNLTLELAMELTGMMEIDFEGNRQMRTERLHAENIVGPAIEFLLEGRKLAGHLAKDWHIGIIERSKNQADKDKPEVTYLEHRAESATVFIHDLLSLRRPRGIVGESLVQKIGELEWVYAKWDLGGSGVINIPWLPPPWLSFWEHDFLRRGWNDSWMWLRYAEPVLNKLIGNASGISAFLAFVWIKICTIVLKSEKYDADDKDNFYNFYLPEYDKLETQLNINNTKEHLEGNSNISELWKKIQKHTDKAKLDLDDLLRIVPPMNEWLLLVEKVNELAMSVREHWPEDSEESDNSESEEDGESVGNIGGDGKDGNNGNAAGGGISGSDGKDESDGNAGGGGIAENDGKNGNDESAGDGGIAGSDGKAGSGESVKSERKAEFSPRRRELIRGWLARIACMLAPESGVSSRIVMLFFLYKDEREDNNLLKLWMEPDVARQIRTIRAKSAAKFCNWGEFEKAFELFCPQERSEMVNKTKLFDPWPGGHESKQETTDCIKEEINLKWALDYETRRNAVNILGDEMFCPVLEEIQNLTRSDYSSIIKDEWENNEYIQKTYRDRYMIKTKRNSHNDLNKTTGGKPKTSENPGEAGTDL